MCVFTQTLTTRTRFASCRELPSVCVCEQEAVCSVQAKLAAGVATLGVLTDDATRKAGDDNLVAKLAAQLAAAGKEVPEKYQRDLRKLTTYLADVLAGKEE